MSDFRRERGAGDGQEQDTDCVPRRELLKAAGIGGLAVGLGGGVLGCGQLRPQAGSGDRFGASS